MQIGNPVLDFATDFNSRSEFLWSHGLISDSTFRMFTSMCNYSRYVGEYYRGSVSPICSRVMTQVSKETSRFVDKYDVTLDVCISSVFSQSKILNPQVSSEPVNSLLFGFLRISQFFNSNFSCVASYRVSRCLRRGRNS